MYVWRSYCEWKSSGTASIPMRSPCPTCGLFTRATRKYREELVMRRTVVIDCFPESVEAYRAGYAIAAVDVIRATTSAVTGRALGRRGFPTPTPEAAVPLASLLSKPLPLGYIVGSVPRCFHLN